MDIKSCIKNCYKNSLYKFYISLKYLLLREKRSCFNVKNSRETIDYIIKNKCSVSRYGDGEFDMIFHYLAPFECSVGGSFQKYDEKLANRLYQILKEKHSNSNHIVCIPYWLFSGGSYYTISTQFFCKEYFCRNYKRLLTSIDQQRQYYDANISRFYLSYKDKSQCRNYILLMKKIWERRKVCFVEGEYSRLGVGNDLFSNADSIRRIICPSVNAFECYDEILNTIRRLVSKDELIIIALGHTATILAYDLSSYGFQAIDLGHIDVEYEWMLLGATTKIALKNKYVNEVAEGRKCQECNNPDYKSQIIAKVSVM